MLQINQTEKPTCSATIDQMRLRRAMILPFEFQNASSSGFHSDIQVGSLRIRDFLSKHAVHRDRLSEAWRRAPGMPRSGSAKNSDDRFQRTASMASAPAIQASCQPTATQKSIILE